MQANAGTAALARMRAAMRPHHDRIEHALDLMTPALTRDRYMRFLERSYGFIFSCEQSLDLAGAPPALELDSRLRSDLIRQDLFAMGRQTSDIEMPVALPQVGQWPCALGYFYVIEGSTLGGQILSRHVHKAGIPEDATTFLRSGQADVGVMWKRMLAILAEAMRDASAEQQITDTAAATFDLLRRWHEAGTSRGSEITSPPRE